MNSPPGVARPSWRSSLTRTEVRTSMPMSRSSFSAEAEMRAGSAGSTRSAASIRVMRTSLRGSMLCTPKARSTLLVWRSSADSSTPVAPAPMMAIDTSCGSPRSARASARMQAATSFWRKRSASCVVSSAIVCSSAPGMPKVFTVLPMAITRWS